MEQFTKLPQVKISHLEHIISQRPKKRNHFNQKITTVRHSTAVLGQKPFYTHDRKTYGLCCSHLKCSCKKNQANCNDSRIKYRFLVSKSRGRKYGAEYMIRFKTQALQKDNQLIQEVSRRLKPTSSNLKQHGSTQIAYNTQQRFSQNLDGLYQRIQKELQRRLLLRFGKQSQNQDVKMLVRDFVKKYYKNKEPFKNMLQLFEKIEKYINQKSQKQKQKVVKQRALQKIQQTEKKQNSQKLPKTTQKKKQKKTKKTKSKKKQKNKEEEEDEQVNTTKIDDETIDLINLLLYRDKKELIEQFLSQMVSTNIKKFDQNMKRIQDIVDQYSNQPRIRVTLNQIMLNLEDRIEKSSIQSQLKQSKLQKVQKLIRFKLPSSIYQPQSQLNLKPVPTRKITKTKRSQKTVRLINLQIPQQPLESKFKSTVSLAQRIEDDQNSSKSKQLSSLNMLTNKSNKSKIKTSKSSLKYMNNYEDGCKAQEQAIPDKQPQIENKSKSWQELSQEQIQQYLKQKNKKKTIRRSTNNDSNRSPTVNTIQIPYKPPAQSNFKHEKDLEIHTIRQKYKKYSLDIKEFMYDNKQTIIKGINKLKDYHLQKLIIGETDSILTKKKKIRIIKQKINQFGILNKKCLVDELLAYIHLYELQCLLILSKGEDEKTRIFENENQFYESNESKLIKMSMLDDELKFIQLSKDYYYGQHEDQELNFQFNNNRYGLEEFKPKTDAVLEKMQEIGKLSNKAQGDSQNILIQSQLPHIGHIQDITKPNILNGTPKKKVKKINGEKQNCQNDKPNNKSKRKRQKIRWVSQADGEKSFNFKKLDKFLLTQNTMCS